MTQEYVDLRGLTGEERAKWKAAIEELGYDFDEYVDNEPYAYTREGATERLKEIALESGMPQQFVYYLDTDAMLEDDRLSGYVTPVDIDSEQYWVRLF